MRLAALFSGGKDSSLAVQRAIEQGHEVSSLVSIIPGNPESYMFHYPNTGLTRLQAEAAGIPLVSRKTRGIKEKELDDMELALKGVSGISGVIVGAIGSRYQRDRVRGVCEKLGLSVEAPLWGQDPMQLWLELLAKGFKVMMVGVACDGLGKEWLGRVMSHKALEELDALSRKHRFHLSGEGGEFETMVLDAPFFRKRLVVKEAGISWEAGSGMYLISRASLEDKKPGFPAHF